MSDIVDGQDLETDDECQPLLNDLSGGQQREEKLTEDTSQNVSPMRQEWNNKPHQNEYEMIPQRRIRDKKPHQNEKWRIIQRIMCAPLIVVLAVLVIYVLVTGSGWLNESNGSTSPMAH